MAQIVTPRRQKARFIAHRPARALHLHWRSLGTCQPSFNARLGASCSVALDGDAVQSSRSSARPGGDPPTCSSDILRWCTWAFAVEPLGTTGCHHLTTGTGEARPATAVGRVLAECGGREGSQGASGTAHARSVAWSRQEARWSPCAVAGSSRRAGSAMAGSMRRRPARDLAAGCRRGAEARGAGDENRTRTVSLGS
jgi:hypothetical protein